MNLCIFLTASIDPPNTIGLHRKDIKSREQDYLQALKFYSQFNFPIVFCENSGYVSESIVQLCKQLPDKIEYLSFISTESHKGKSHGETEIFDYVHLHSRFIKNADLILKVTGRLILENFSSMIAKMQRADVWVFANVVKNFSFAESKFFGYKKEFYSDFLQSVLHNQLDDSNRFYFERCLARAIHKMLAEQDGYSMLPEYPFFDGYNGTTNRSYKKTAIGKLKFKAYYKAKMFLFRHSI